MRTAGIFTVVETHGPSLRWWLVTVAAVVGFTAQGWHTVLGRNRWPLCTYDLFAYHLPEQMPQARVRLTTAAGSVVGPADPWGLLPLEFFRVVSILERVFFTNDDSAVRDDWCCAVLNGLNAAPWKAHDEVRAALAPPLSERFVALEVFLVHVDFALCESDDRLHVLSAELVHAYDPCGALPTVEDPHWRYVCGV